MNKTSGKEEVETESMQRYTQYCQPKEYATVPAMRETQVTQSPTKQSDCHHRLDPKLGQEDRQHYQQQQFNYLPNRKR